MSTTEAQRHKAVLAVGDGVPTTPGDFRGGGTARISAQFLTAVILVAAGTAATTHLTLSVQSLKSVVS